MLYVVPQIKGNLDLITINNSPQGIYNAYTVKNSLNE